MINGRNKNGFLDIKQLENFKCFRNIKTMKLKSLILLAVLFPAVSQSDNNIYLVENNKALSGIIIPDKAIPCEKLAAEELQYHIEKASGVRLLIHNEKETFLDLNHYIYIGNCGKTIEAGIDVLSLTPSAYVIRTVGGNIFIAGKDRDTGPVGNAWFASWAGTLFGVYDLLENELGVRWLWPGKLGEVIPQTEKISFTNIDRSGKPEFVYTRLIEAGSKKYITDGWASLKNKENFLKDQARFLLRHRFSSIQNMNYDHNFADYWERFGKSNPEYFHLLPNGKREPLAGDTAGNFISLCLSQPLLLKQIIADWKNRAHKEDASDRPYVNACENDTPIMCTCEKCRALDADDPRFATSDYWGKGITLDNSHKWALAKADWGEDQSCIKEQPALSDRYASFCLNLLSEAKKIKPDAKVIGYAYANYTEPPKTVKLNEDIIIINVYPLWFPYTAEMSNAFRKNWEGWKNTGAVLYFRPNLLNAGANLPIFYARQFVNDFSFAARNGMIASQLDSLLGAWSAQGPTLYAVARVHEHPDWSADKILNEYYSGFGKARDAVKKYFEYWESYSAAMDKKSVEDYCLEEKDKTGRSGGTFKNYVRIAHRLFTPESFSNARKLINKAIENAKGDTLAEQRVSFIEKGLTDAELTTTTRAAQSQMEKSPSEENRKAFEVAFKKLVEYRADIESENILKSI